MDLFLRVPQHHVQYSVHWTRLLFTAGQNILIVYLPGSQEVVHIGCCCCLAALWIEHNVWLLLLLLQQARQVQQVQVRCEGSAVAAT